MWFKKFDQHQIDVNSLGCRNLRSIQSALCHLIDLITAQHQAGCESVMLVKKDVLIVQAKVDIYNLGNQPVDMEALKGRDCYLQNNSMCDILF